MATAGGTEAARRIVLRGADGALSLAAPAAIAADIVARLDRHIIMDDVEVALDDSLRFAFVWGEGVTPASAPGPMIVTSRTRSCRKRSIIASFSVSRPMKAVA